MKNIFVGNLPYSATEEQIQSLFEQYGGVSRVKIITDRDTGRSRGFGFVEMDNDEEGDRAIEATNGYGLDGRQLNVNEARPRRDDFRGGGGGGGGGGGRW